MNAEIKVFTYWETSKYSQVIPPYILCGLVSMRRALGDKFLILTRENVGELTAFDFDSKDFYFAASADKKKDSISRITAKSDFARFRYIDRNGGIWIDADTIVLSNFIEDIMPIINNDKFAWHSEQFFGARPGHPVVHQVVENMIASQRQIFANPGGVKELFQKTKNTSSELIPHKLIDPTGNHSYASKSWDTTVNTDIAVSEFIKNKDCKIVKIYNSNLQGVNASQMSVSEFLSSGMLMSRIFLSLESDMNYWLHEAETLSGLLQ